MLFLLVAGFGAVITAGLLSGLHYTETASFCGRCHTMGPEMKAYNLSPHRQVACAECHVKPGLLGAAEAKANGAKQLFQVMTGTFPKPIPPPNHSSLPPVTETCLRCHSLQQITKNEGPVKIVLRPRYQLDERNTQELVALVLRPAGIGGDTTVLGVHWHVQQKVTYSSPDTGRTIDLVEVKRPDGTVEQYISGTSVNVSTEAQQDVAKVKNGETNRVMDCLDCHNRTGHGVPSIDQALDDSITAGRISRDLPFIKRDAVALLNAKYPSLAAADRAMDGLGASYRGNYPLIQRTKGAEIAAASKELKQIYRLIATPEMKVEAKTYPNNLGHQTTLGCFRCHDGAHYQVVNGQLTQKVIPSTCSTCHTFPQVGGAVTNILLGGAPDTHADKLYVFNHKKLVSTLDPNQASCGACHDRTYCVNCHATGALKVNHDEMLYNHAASIRKSGGQACAYCHQAVYCARCHRDPVLQTSAGGG